VRFVLSMLFVLLTASATMPVKLVPGQFDPSRNPDGNTIIFEDKKGLIVVDTGRHAEHQQAILDYARLRAKPIVAIVNTHWHLDHTGGNRILRAAFPQAKIYTSNAVVTALDGFLSQALARAQASLANPALTEAGRREITLMVKTIEDRRDLIPDYPVTGPTKIPFAPRPLELRLAPNAATEGDTWLYDPSTRTLVAGDLVVLPGPFFDTACAKGWRNALDQIAKVRFKTLIPGHGAPLSYAQFEIYRVAFDHLVDCASDASPNETCIAGWRHDAASLLLSPSDRDNAEGLVAYYLDHQLRDAKKQAEFCGVA
jgi:glyoxylase-like metal-dependent hydrolase (beta-lactamase superfamily II)